MNRLKQYRENLKSYKHLVKILAVVMVVTTALLFSAMKGGSETISIEEAGSETVGATETTEQAETPANATTFYVDVGGEVKKPGVYELPANARIFEAIDLAGGLTKDADTSALNQAEVIQDGMKIFVPSMAGASGEEGTSVASDGGSSASTTSGDGKVNINTADLMALQSIPGVGPVTAQKILDYRGEHGRFQSIEEIKNVSGIGEKTYEKMMQAITI